MLVTQTSTSPRILSLSPSVVEVGWEGLVKIHGEGFDRFSFATFNSAQPAVIDQSDSFLAVEIHPDLTANPGKISVQVHTVESGPSNVMEFTVRAR